MRTLPGLTDVNSDLQIANPQANVVVDRDKASALGVTPQEVEDALYSAYGQRQVSPIYTSNNEYWVSSRSRIASRAIPRCSLSSTSTLLPANSFRSAPSQNLRLAWVPSLLTTPASSLRLPSRSIWRPASLLARR